MRLRQQFRNVTPNKDVTIKSEPDFIQKYLAPLTLGAPGTFGLLDDTAIIPVPDGHELVVTTDAVATGVHFFADDNASDIAWKALAVNVSDLIAKGAKPLCYQMALAFEETPSDDWMRDFAKGLGTAQTAFGMYLSGGDTDVRNAPLSITITAFGIVPKGRLIRRSTARNGDRIYISNTVGDSALGLALRQDAELMASLKEFDENDLGYARDLCKKYLWPRPPVMLQQSLLDYASAAMDISDGLAQDLGKMAAASGVGAEVDLMRLELSEPAIILISLRPELNLLERVLTGGDDYEVLFAVPPKKARDFEAAAMKAPTTVQHIGEFTEDKAVRFLDRDGKTIQLNSGGWDHFRKSQ